MHARSLTGLVLSMLSGCANRFLPSDLPQPSTSAPSASVAAPSPSDETFVDLFYDRLRLEALRDFYIKSSNHADIETDPSRFLVLVNSRSIEDDITRYIPRGHGYLLDDCGLVLTAYHVVTIDSPPLFVRDLEGRLYRANPTTFVAPSFDYALLVVETNKPGHSHPLCFASPSDYAFNEPVSFSTYFAEPQAPLPSPLSLVPHDDGKILSLQDMLRAALRNEDLRDGSTSRLKLDLERHENNNSLFFSSTVFHGYSGTPIFHRNGSFLGVINRFAPFIDDESSERQDRGCGLAIRADHIFTHLRLYIEEQNLLEKQ